MSKVIEPPLVVYKCDLESKKHDVTTIEVSAVSKRDAVIKARNEMSIKFPKKEFEVIEVEVKTSSDRFEIDKFNPNQPEDNYSKIKQELENRR